MRPFDRARPLWEAVVINGLEGGQAAYILKAHHSITDGIGGVQLLALLHSRSREPMRNRPEPAAPPADTRTPVEILAGQAARRALDAPAWAVRQSAAAAEPDPRERMRQVREFVITARAEPAVNAATLLSPTLSHLPSPLAARILASMTSSNDAQVSNVPGIPYPVYIAGARITRMYPFGPLPGCAAMITLISHDGTCCIGINTDAAAITDPALFRTCLGEGIDEILALRPAPRPATP